MLLLNESTHSPDNLTNVDYPKFALPASQILYLIFSGILSIVIVLGNMLIIVSWCIDKKLRTISNFFLMSLAIPDLIIGAVSIPMYLAKGFSQTCRFGTETNQFLSTITVTSTFVSSSHLVLIALDRYKVVTYGITYIQHQSFKMALQAVLLMWFTGLCISSPYIFMYNKLVFVSVSNGCRFEASDFMSVYCLIFIRLLPGILLICLNYKIFVALKQRIRRKPTNREESFGDSNTQKTGNSSGADDKKIPANPIISVDKNAATKISDREWRAAKTLGILVVCFIICWFPHAMVNILRIVFEISVPRAVSRYVHVLGWINSAVNPFVYAYHNLEFKSAFRKILSGLLCLHYCKNK